MARHIYEADLTVDYSAVSPMASGPMPDHFKSVDLDYFDELSERASYAGHAIWNPTELFPSRFLGKSERTMKGHTQFSRAKNGARRFNRAERVGSSSFVASAMYETIASFSVRVTSSSE